MSSSPGNLAPGAGSPLVPGGSQGLIVHGAGRRTAYLYSRKNLVATSTSLIVAVTLVLTGLAGLLWPLVAVGVYLLTALAVPQARLHQPGPGWHPDEVRQALDTQVRGLAGKVPGEVYGKVTALQSSILELLPRVEHLPPGSEDLFIVERTALDYLPAALDAYLNLPRAYASVRRAEGGKTPTEVLEDELSLLQLKLSEISDNVAAGDSDTLLANGRFLDEKFGRSELDLRRPRS